MAELALVFGACCIGKTHYVQRHLPDFVHVAPGTTEDMSFHRMCKQVGALLSAGRNVAFEAPELVDSRTRAETADFVRQKVCLERKNFTVRSVWVTTADPEAERLACEWFHGKKVLTARMSGAELSALTLAPSRCDTKTALGVDVSLRHAIDRSWRASVEAHGRPCLFLGIHEATYFAPQQKKLVLRPLVLELLVRWLAVAGRIAVFVQAGCGENGDRYTVKSLAAMWIKQRIPCECHLLLSGLAIDAADEQGEVAPVPLCAASLSLLQGLASFCLPQSVALGAFDEATSRLWNSFGVRFGPLEMCSAAIFEKIAPSGTFGQVDSPASEPWIPRKLGHKLAYWHARGSWREDEESATALCVSLSSVVDRFGADAAALGKKYVDAGLAEAPAAEVRRMSNAVVALTNCKSSDRSKNYRVEVGAASGNIVYCYCTCGTSVDPYTGLSHCRHAVAICVALSRMNRADVWNEEDDKFDEISAAEGEEPERSHGTLYQPQLTAVDSDGLPLHMARAKPTRGTKSEAAVRFPKVSGPNAPRRPSTPFFFFCRQRRRELLKEQPGLRLTEAAVLLGKEWREMPSEQKARITAECTEEAKKAQAEWKEYENTDEYRTAATAAQAHRSPKPKKHCPEVPEVKEDRAEPEVPAAAGTHFEALNKEWRTEGGRWVCEWDDEPVEPVPPARSGAAARLASLYVDESDGDHLVARASTRFLETQASSAVLRR